MKKQRIVQTCIALLAALFVLGFVSCGDGGNNNNNNNNPNTPGDATLTGVKFGNETATLGTAGDTLAAATPGSVLLLSKTATVTVTKKDSKATLQYWTDKGTGEGVDWYPGADSDFEQGDILCIEVTNGSTKKYYKIIVNIAGKTTITKFTINGQQAGTLNNPGASWSTAGNNAILLQIKPSEQGAGLSVEAVTLETAATVLYGHAIGDADPTSTFAATLGTLVDKEYVYVKVTFAGPPEEIGYYKFQINFVQEGNIKYGTPTIDAQNLDAMWNDPDLDVYHIEKIYPNDSGAYISGLADGTYEPTSAWAKAYWDEEGLTVLVVVTDPDVTLVDPKSHECDSFELFVNEALSEATNNKSYSNGGSQYRVGAGGERSGEGDSPAALEALNKTAAYKTDIGYNVVMKAPWRLRSKFFSSTTYRAGWKFGFELQLNIGPETGSRYGVLVWNNISHTNYQNATDYGEATLVGAPAGGLNYPALPPIITTQPAGGAFMEGESTTLTVAAGTPLDGGTLSYEWFKAEGQLVGSSWAPGEFTTTGITTASLSLDSLTEGRTYYYVNVKNTISGNKTAITKSAQVAVVVSGKPQANKIVLKNGAYAIFKVELPVGAKWGDYASASAQFYLDETNMAASIRGVRLMGNYAASLVSSGSVSLGSYNATHIMDNITSAGKGYGAWQATAADISGAEANKWFNITYDISGKVDTDKGPAHNGFAAANLPADADTGPFYFGVGISGQETGPIEQLIRNVTLVHKTDKSKNAVSNEYVAALVNVAGDVTQGLVDDPAPEALLKPLVIDNPTLSICGGSISDNTITGTDGSYIKKNGNVAEVKVILSKTNLGMSYEFPENWKLFEKVEVKYTVTVIDTLAKYTTKQGFNSISDDVLPTGTGGQYLQTSSGGDFTLTIPLEYFNKPIMNTAPGLSFQVNTWNDEATTPNTQEYTFEVTKMTFIPAE